MSEAQDQAMCIWAGLADYSRYSWQCDSGGKPLSIVCSWTGVSCTTRVVTSLSLSFLTGVLPTVVGDLTGLQSLVLDGSALTGSLPSTVGSLTNLVVLQASGCGVSGSIPSTVGYLTKLTKLSLGSNKLTGKFSKVSAFLSTTL